MPSVAPQLRPALLLASSCLLLGSGLTAQTMSEYGHLAGGAAAAAAKLRKSAPAASPRRLSQPSSAPSSSFAASRTFSAPAPPVNPAYYEPEALTVLRVNWGDSEAAQTAPTETFEKKVVLSPEPAPDPAPTPPDLGAKGLRDGMSIAEVSKILGDPSVRTAGLAGRGYDAKFLYKLSDGWRVTVFALRGRATAFVTAPVAQKTDNSVLRAADSVIP